MRCGSLVVHLAACLVAAGVGLPAARAQDARAWNDARTSALVDRAIARRGAQLADTGLADYKATAHGLLTFLAQLGEGYPDPPQVVRADEIAVEVYWRAPNQSKQRVVGRRDTLLLPTDIAYHRDHLAIVQNNFPAIIRLGDGDEVRDVPHPLSPRGREAYDFATTDSLTIRVGARAWDVMQVDVRPRDDRQPRVVGALFLDRATASVVRMSISFTRAALLDPALDDVTVVLDNALVEGRFWLPRRQEIEIRRSGTWLDFPARGIIRGAWDLCCVETNRGTPGELFAGPEITFAPAAALAAYPFAGRLADTVAVLLRESGGTIGSADAVQAHATTLVREAVLRRAGAALSARRASDFARSNRVEGLALGGGVTWRGPGAWSLGLTARYGLDDRRGKFEATVGREVRGGWRLSLGAFDGLRGVGEAEEASVLANSFAAQEVAADVTDDYRVAGAALAVERGTTTRWRAAVERVGESPVAVHATPASGVFRPAFAAERTTLTRLTLELAARRTALPGEIRGAVTLRAALAVPDGATGPRSYSRLAIDADLTRETRAGTFVSRTLASTVFGAAVPVQELAAFGGPVSAPGYDTHSLRGPSGIAQRVEWQARVGSFTLPLGRFGTTRVPIIVAPFVQGAVLGGSDGHAYRSIGVGILTLHGVLRLDVACGVDRGGGLMVRVDAVRRFWPIL
jgi:hypothetical protein